MNIRANQERNQFITEVFKYIAITAFLILLASLVYSNFVTNTHLSRLNTDLQSLNGTFEEVDVIEYYYES